MSLTCHIIYCEILDKVANFSELQFIYTYNGENQV